MDVLEVKQVGYTYQSKYQTVRALEEVSCSFARGRFYAIVGPSGSGKTTLLSLLAGLDLPSEGEVLVEGGQMKLLDRDAYRRDKAAVVYQAFHLFPLLNALENVMFPMELQGKSKHESMEAAGQFLAEVGLPEKIHKQRPLMMSGGEQQRVAIARALAAGGSILLADEPTGNLDTTSGEIVIEILKKLAHGKNYAVIAITHNMDLARQADIVYTMRDGRLTEG